MPVHRARAGVQSRGGRGSPVGQGLCWCRPCPDTSHSRPASSPVQCRRAVSRRRDTSARWASCRSAKTTERGEGGAGVLELQRLQRQRRRQQRQTAAAAAVATAGRRQVLLLQLPAAAQKTQQQQRQATHICDCVLLIREPAHGLDKLVVTTKDEHIAVGGHDLACRGTRWCRQACGSRCMRGGQRQPAQRGQGSSGSSRQQLLCPTGRPPAADSGAALHSLLQNAFWQAWMPQFTVLPLSLPGM